MYRGDSINLRVRAGSSVRLLYGEHIMRLSSASLMACIQKYDTVKVHTASGKQLSFRTFKKKLPTVKFATELLALGHLSTSKRSNSGQIVYHARQHT